MQNKEPIYAGFFVRMAAFIIDNIIVWFGLLLIRIPFGIMSMTSSDNFLVKDFIFQYSVIDIVLYLAGCAYFILMTYYSGSTVGKRLMHIKVISCEDRKLTFFEVAFRETIGWFLAGIIVDAGYIMVGVDKDKRGFHDILADTRVVYEHPKPQYVTPLQPKPMPRPVYHPGTGMVQPGGGPMNMPGNGTVNMPGNGMPPQPPFNQGVSPYGDTQGYRDTLTGDIRTPNPTGYHGESRMPAPSGYQRETGASDTFGNMPEGQPDSFAPDAYGSMQGNLQQGQPEFGETERDGTMRD